MTQLLNKLFIRFQILLSLRLEKPNKKNLKLNQIEKQTKNLQTHYIQVQLSLSFRMSLRLKLLNIE